MTTIYKYKLILNTRQILALPVGAKILSFQVQDGNLMLWALVNEKEEAKEDRTFFIYGTGHAVTDASKLNFIGTVQLSGFVWHLFEKSWLA